MNVESSYSIFTAQENKYEFGPRFQFGETYPLRRAGRPAELASIYVQLAANDASYTPAISMELGKPADHSSSRRWVHAFVVRYRWFAICLSLSIDPKVTSLSIDPKVT